MKIIGTKYVEVDIDEHTQTNIMFARLGKLLNWHSDYYIEDGYVKREHDRKPRDWVEEIRKATKRDALVWRLYRELLK
jgi:hypothetical protein